jgi:hypothetical protein
METLILQTHSKKESKLLTELLHKMNIKVAKLSQQRQEDFVFGRLIKDAVKQGEVKASSIERIIDKWK